jgi:hypothetical protein
MYGSRNRVRLYSGAFARRRKPGRATALRRDLVSSSTFRKSGAISLSRFTRPQVVNVTQLASMHGASLDPRGAPVQLPAANGRCGFREGTFAGTHGNGQDARSAVIVACEQCPNNAENLTPKYAVRTCVIEESFVTWFGAKRASDDA